MSGNEFIPDPNLSPLRQKLQRMKWEQEQKEEAKPKPAFVKSQQEAAAKYAGFEDVIPEVESVAADMLGPVKDTDAKIDSILDRLSFKEAYVRYIGKMTPDERKSGGGIGEVMISCPWPGHEDKNPTASYNIKSRLFHCHGQCDRGGDIMDLAAIYHGMEGDYKEGIKFHELRRKIGEDYGLKFQKNTMGRWVAKTPEEIKRDEEEVAEAIERATAPKPEATVEEEPTTVVSISTGKALEYDDGLPKIDWKEFAQPGTFIHDYVMAAKEDDCPEEWHLWFAFMALSMVSGRRVYGVERRIFYSNLFICILGDPGAGKSLAKDILVEVLEKVAPWDPEVVAPEDNGVYMLPRPGSGEALIDLFNQKYEQKDAQGKVTVSRDINNVKGFLDIDEMSDMFGRTSRQGSTLKETLQQFIDAKSKVTSHSLTTKHREAKNAFCSILTTSQPDALSKLLSEQDSNSGFLSRMIFATGKYKPIPGISTVQIDTSIPVGSLTEIYEWAQEEDRALPWSSAALELFNQYQDEVMEPNRLAAESKIVARIRFTIKKLALLFSINKMESEITLEATELAIKMYPYLLETYKKVDSKIGRTLLSDQENAIIEWVRDYPKGHPQQFASKSDVVQCFKNRKGFDIKGIRSILDNLIESNMLLVKEAKVVGKAKRPKKEWLVAAS